MRTSFHSGFEHKAWVRSHRLCRVYSPYHPVLTMHAWSLTHGPTVSRQDLQRPADHVSFSQSTLPSALPPAPVCPWLLSCCPPGSLPSPAARMWPRAAFARASSSYGASRCFSSLHVATIFGKKNLLFVGAKVTSLFPGLRGRNDWLVVNLSSCSFCSQQ